MNKSTKYALIIIGIIIVLFLTYKKVMPILDAKAAFKKALTVYDFDVVVNCEKIFRLETNNFLSGQFTGTYSPGMEPATLTYPYGWSSLKPFWDDYPEYKPIGLKNYTENGTGINKPFIQFPTPEAAIFTVCNRLVLNGNNAGAWFSNDEIAQATYEAKLTNINASFCNA
jgi:hypothetical protein